MDKTLAVETAVTLSPSRAADFKVCPQLYKFRVIDQLPEDAGPAGARGSLVHAVLQELFGLAPSQRTLPEAKRMLVGIWTGLKESPELQGLEVDEAGMLAEAEELLTNYFTLEDPASVDAHELEWWVEYKSEEVVLRGIIDRIEIDAGGDIVITDYKTGRSPSEMFALGAFFGLKFYALVCWRNLGRIPKLLRLVHLQGSAGPEVITLRPTAQMLEGMEKQLAAVSSAIERAKTTGDWRPKPSRACNWCAHQAVCPAFAG